MMMMMMMNEISIDLIQPTQNLGGTAAGDREGGAQKFSNFMKDKICNKTTNNSYKILDLSAASQAFILIKKSQFSLHLNSSTQHMKCD